MADQRSIDAAGIRLTHQVWGPLALRIPDARVVTIPVGHLIHHAAPEAFVETVSAFLLTEEASVPPSSP